MDEKNKMADPPKFLRVTEVASLLECSENHAYKIIQQLNKELEANPITANSRRTGIKDDIKSRLNRYKNVEGFTAVWVWAEKVSDTEYEIYIGYC